MTPPIRRTYALRDGEISALHFGRIENPLKLVFLHANGFNAQAYARVLGPLGVHAAALDMRGHGSSVLPTDPRSLRNWHIFRDDAVEFFARYVERPVVLAGHSFGAVSGILAAPQISAKINGYVGFDPVMVPGLFRLWSASQLGRRSIKKRLPIAASAGRRKSVFTSPEDAFARYQGRGAFKGISDEILRDYLIDGLKADGAGAWKLACEPQWEQAIFAAQAHNLFKAAHALPDNSHIIFAGGRGAVSSPKLRAQLQRQQPNIQITLDPKFEHLFPFQHPEQATQALRDVLAKAALG